MLDHLRKSHLGTESLAPSKELYDLCQMHNWHKVVRHCRINSVDAQYHGDEGTPLHVACKHQPSVHIIQSLLYAFPSAALIPNTDGYLPLHEACRFHASISVLRELTRNDPATAFLPTSTGDTAVTILCSFRKSTETNMEVNNKAGLWHTKREDLKDVNYSSTFWQKINVLLGAVAVHRQTTQRQSTRHLFILHAAVSLGWCPVEVLRYCLIQFPEQIRLRDGSGKLPLHVAVGPVYNSMNDKILSKLELREMSAIRRLLEFYPEAAHIRDPNEPSDRYALHTALVNGHVWHWGVKELTLHCPESITLQDPIERLYPFQLAAVDLDSVFQLLRNLPSVLLNVRFKPEHTTYEEPPAAQRKIWQSESMMSRLSRRRVIKKMAKGLVWEPLDAAGQPFEDTENNGKNLTCSTRFMMRFSPVQAACFARFDDIQHVVRSLLRPIFALQQHPASTRKGITNTANEPTIDPVSAKWDSGAATNSKKGSTTFAVQAQRHIFGRMRRDLVIQDAMATVVSAVAVGWTVNLRAPDYTIMIELCLNWASISILPAESMKF